jgi:hypothetical protein
MIQRGHTFVDAGADSATGAGLCTGKDNSFSSRGGSEIAGVSSGNSDLFSTGDAETSCPDTEVAAGAGAGAVDVEVEVVVGPATAAAYLIGGILVFAVGTGGVGSAFVTFGNSAFVLSKVDFLDGCFLAMIGLGGSSIGGAGLDADEGIEIDGERSLAGVLGAVAVTGGVVDSV